MRKTIIWMAMLSLVLGLGLVQAEAVSMWVNPASQTIGVGDTAQADIMISGLGSDGAPPTLTSWQLDVAFDGGILALADAFYGTGLGPAWGDLPYEFTMVSTPGSAVHLAQFSLSPTTLEATQPDQLSLAILRMTGLATGTSPLSLRNVSLADSLSQDGTALALSDPKLTDGSVTVTGGAAPVPEPATLVLLGVGLAGMGLARRRRQMRK